MSTGSWKQDKFYLSTFVPTSTDGADTKNAIKLCKEAGLNLVEVNSISDARYCDEIGINSIIDLGKWNNPNYSQAELYDIMWNSSFVHSIVGYYTWDEVNTNSINDAASKNAFVKKYDPARLAYSVIYPSYANVTWNTDYSYDEYVKDYLDTVNPEVLAFDYYPIQAHGLNSSNVNDVMKCDWWRDMGLMRKMSNDYNKPFWYYVQSVDITTSIGNIPQSQIALQLYSGLAYGADYLSYYMAPGYLYSMDGREKTERFEEGAALNKKIVNIGNLLLGKKSEKIYHTGFSLIENWNNKLDDKFYLDKISSSELISSAPDDLIISQFSGDNGEKYLVVVNKNYNNTASGKLKLKASKSVSLFDAQNGTTSNLGSVSDIPLNIPAGEGVVYIIK